MPSFLWIRPPEALAHSGLPVLAIWHVRPCGNAQLLRLHCSPDVDVGVPSDQDMLADVLNQPRLLGALNQVVRKHADAAAGARLKLREPLRQVVQALEIFHHDAAIVEKVWGHDLRVEGVVVEYLEGLDNLPERLAEFQPGPGRRIGVLADHLIEGTKESRLVEHVGEHVLVTGHPYIDIWAAVKPEKLRIPAWPDVPYGEDWKTGVCERLGWSDPKEGWHRVYNAVETFRDLDSTLIGAVERLVDFVTNPDLSKQDLVP